MILITMMMFDDGDDGDENDDDGDDEEDDNLYSWSAEDVEL